MKIDPRHIAFDIDGVVADVVTPFLRLLDERYGYKGFTHEDIVTFDLVNTLGIPRSVYDEILDTLLERPIEAGVRPYPGAAAVLESIVEQTSLLFVTSRPTSNPMKTWFETALPGLPGNRIDILATGDPLEKLKPLVEKGKKYFIDDHPETCRQLGKAGLEAFVFDRPWNRRDVDLPRIKGWDHLKTLF